MRAGFVAMVGLPNAGKSTIVNALIGEKVGIVSKKPQTTRKRVIGVLNRPDSQICFMDAPGRVRSETGLNSFLEKELTSIMRESDACLAVLNLDAHKMEDLRDIVELVKKSGRPWAVIVNKTDLDPGLREAKLRAELLNELAVSGIAIITCSALSCTSHSSAAERNAEALREKILPVVRDLLPETEQPLFDGDIYTTQSTRDLVAELVREKCFEYLHQEIPYGLAVRVLKYDESHKNPRIFVEIVVTKDNFVSMVVGQGGAMIKRIGSSARIEAEKVLGHKIYLETHVKVKKDWAKNPEVMKELGYVITE
jgi:GTP-binding protein Era